MADRQRAVSEAGADADYFTAILEEYQRHPDIVASTLWHNRIRSVLRQVDAQYVVREREDGAQELRLLVGPPPERP